MNFLLKRALRRSAPLAVATILLGALCGTGCAAPTSTSTPATGMAPEAATTMSTVQKQKAVEPSNSIKPVQKSIPFQSGTEGYHNFRIPALVRAADGSLLAFCQGRVNSHGDHGKIDIRVDQ